jgi:hypothetical protein
MVTSNSEHSSGLSTHHAVCDQPSLGLELTQGAIGGGAKDAVDNHRNTCSGQGLLYGPHIIALGEGVG